MRHVEAPTEYEGPAPSLYLAGGVTACDDWQGRVAELLAASDLVLLDPRRRNFPDGDPAAAEGQTRWEFRHLRRAAGRLFWFPAGTLRPMTLYELGAWSMRAGPLFVGVDPGYARRHDVEVQTGLARPDVRVVYSPEDLAEQVLNAERAGAFGPADATRSIA